MEVKEILKENNIEYSDNRTLSEKRKKSLELLSEYSKNYKIFSEKLFLLRDIMSYIENPKSIDDDCKEDLNTLINIILGEDEPEDFIYTSVVKSIKNSNGSLSSPEINEELLNLIKNS